MEAPFVFIFIAIIVGFSLICWVEDCLSGFFGGIFLTLSVGLVLWFGASLAMNATDYDIEPQYVVSHTIDGVDICVYDGNVINLNKELCVDIPERSKIKVIHNKKWYLGINWMGQPTFEVVE